MGPAHPRRAVLTACWNALAFQFAIAFLSGPPLPSLLARGGFSVSPAVVPNAVVYGERACCPGRVWMREQGHVGSRVRCPDKRTGTRCGFSYSTSSYLFG